MSPDDQFGQNNTIAKSVHFVTLTISTMSIATLGLLHMFDTMYGDNLEAYGTSHLPSTNLNGTITRVIDGDTVDILVNDGITERIGGFGRRT